MSKKKKNWYKLLKQQPDLLTPEPAKPIAPIARESLGWRYKVGLLALGLFALFPMILVGLWDGAYYPPYAGLAEVDQNMWQRMKLGLGLIDWSIDQQGSMWVLTIVAEEGTAQDKVDLWSSQFRQEVSGRLNKVGDYEYEVEVVWQ